MKIYDEVVEKFGDLMIDLGKAAFIAGIAALFVEKFRFITSIGGVLFGILFLLLGLYAFHFKSRRQNLEKGKTHGEI